MSRALTLFVSTFLSTASLCTLSSLPINKAVASEETEVYVVKLPIQGMSFIHDPLENTERTSSSSNSSSTTEDAHTLKVAQQFPLRIF
jgi:hypothetical protein